MLTAPFAVVRYIASHGKRPANRPRLVILHTNAGSRSSSGEATWRWIEAELAAGRTPTQPHHQVDLDGTVWQYLDYNEKGVGSVSAEGSCITVETQDYGSNAGPIGMQLWSQRQVEALAQVCANAHRVFGVPLVEASAPDGAGIGWHSMWGINTAASKPNPWTIAVGKTCPGSARIGQVGQIIARARELVAVDNDDEEDAEMAKPWLIQSGPSVWITDWVTRRALAPEDLNLLVLLDAVQPLGPNAAGVKEAKPVPVTATVVERIKDVSPGQGGTFPTAGEIAVAVSAEASRRLAA